MHSTSTLIVGGGISGLALAHALRRGGRDVTVLEAGATPGGKMRSWREKGYLLEAGPNGFLDRDAEARELARELGIEERIRPALPIAKKRYVFSRGKLRALPLSPPAFLTSNLLPLSSRLRVLLEPFSRRGDGQDESLAAFASRHLGERATRVLVDAMQLGIWAGDVDRLSARAAFPKLHALEETHRSLVLGAIKSAKAVRRSIAPGAAASSGQLATFDGGMQTLADALVTALGPAIRTERRVNAITREGSKWRLRFSINGSGEETIEADRLVLATPADITARLLEPLDVPLAQELRAIPHAPISVVHLAFSPPVLPEDAVQGFGVLVPSEEKKSVLGVIFASSSFPFRAPEGHTLLTCMVGGAVRPDLAALGDGALLEAVRGDLETMLGIDRDAPCELEVVVRWPQAIPQYEVGHLDRVRNIHARAKTHAGLFLLGSALEGVGVNDCVRTARALAKSMLQDTESESPT